MKNEVSPANGELPSVQQDSKSFHGFEPLDSNFIYCPNQFFDVCLPNCSRGAVRLVGYMIRQTLGFRDQKGNPIRQDITIRYRDFIDKAGISRGGVAAAVEEALRHNFVIQQSSGMAKAKGSASKSACYALNWGVGDSYSADFNSFDGFYTGKGRQLVLLDPTNRGQPISWYRTDEYRDGYTPQTPCFEAQRDDDVDQVGS